MAQLVQLQENLTDLLAEYRANVIVVFREEAEGQDGLRKVVEQTKTEFTLALDTNAVQTSRYSQGNQVHDSYIIDSDGMIRAILAGKRHDRAQAEEFAEALKELRKSK